MLEPIFLFLVSINLQMNIIVQNEIVIKIHTATDISRKNIDKQFDNGHFLWLQQFRIKSY